MKEGGAGKKRRSAGLKKRLSALAAAGSGLVFLLVLSLVYSGIRGAGDAVDTGGLERAKEGIRSAMVTCYAIEGRYPPDYAYLSKHYGLRIDPEQYAVDLQAFASNMMPDIAVVRLR